MQKDGWDKWLIIAKIISLVLIPLILGIAGFFINKQIAHANINQEYVRLAISILTSKQDKELREWAVKIINNYSPEKLTKEVQEGLSTGEINFPHVTSTGIIQHYMSTEKILKNP